MTDPTNMTDITDMTDDEIDALLEVVEGLKHRVEALGGR